MSSARMIPSKATFLACIAVILSLGQSPGVARGQGLGTREYPTPEYYLAREVFHEGDFKTAYQTFRSAGKSGIRSSEGRWVDSICYYAMMGECLYQMGELGAALEQYSAALKLFVVHQNWMLRVDFAPEIGPARAARRPPNWGISTRPTVAGQFGQRYPILQGQGRLENENALIQGGIVALPEFYLINAHEIARCTALATRRRRELMGSACRHDVLTDQVLQALRVRPTRQNHWSQAWIDVQLGMAAAAAGQIQKAVSDLGNGAVALGRFDHPLTAMALFELGKLAFEQEQYAAASKFFHEASLAAATFEQFDLVEESLRWGARTHLATHQRGRYAPLSAAVAWSRRESRFLEVSLLVAAAENAAVVNQTAAAMNLAEQARRRMVRTEMAAGAVGARLSYVNALTNYQTEKLKAGDAAFAALMAYMLESSTRLFEIQIVDRMYVTGALSDRVANNLYAHVLREPTGKDWTVAPVETQTFLIAPLVASLENWFQVALKRREFEQALEIADRIRRFRFYSTLPMGGRLLALRWVLDSPPEALSERAVLQRQALVEQFPLYAELLQRSAAARRELQGLPLVPEEVDIRVEQKRWLDELALVSTKQEVRLREIALRRAPAQMVFPPPLNFKEAQANLRDGQLVLSFLTTSDAVYVFKFGRDAYYPVERLAAPSLVEKEIVLLLRGLGQLDRNLPVKLEALRDERWKDVASRLLEQLAGRAFLDGTLQGLIGVPDGPLWYLPFEALQLTDGSRRVPLASQTRVRYAPTVSLALPDRRRDRPSAETVIVAGKLFPRDDERVAAAAYADFREVLPRVTRLTEPPMVPTGLFAILCDRLIVLSDIDDKVAGPYDWSPMQIDRARPGSALINWMGLPWGGPRQIILPGFHTAAEVSLKNGGGGNEIFLAVCGLMSTGARTILLSRWRPGGQSSYDLVREFVAELPHAPASDAWQRSVQLVMESELVLEREPRVKIAELEAGVNGDHPFFWAGYLLIDTGSSPVDDAAVADAK